MDDHQGAYPVILDLSDIEGSARDQIWHLQFLLSILDQLIEDFDAGVDLVAHGLAASDERMRQAGEVGGIEPPDWEAMQRVQQEARRLRRFAFIGALHASNMVVEVWQCLNGIQETARRTGPLKRRVEFKLIEEAKQRLLTDFPDMKEVRNAGIKRLDQTYSLEKVEKNRDGAVFGNTTLDGDVLSHTTQGRTVRLPINDDSVAKLQAVREIVARAFAAVRG